MEEDACKSEKVVNVVTRAGAKTEAAKDKRDVRKGERGVKPVSPKEVKELPLLEDGSESDNEDYQLG